MIVILKINLRFVAFQKKLERKHKKSFLLDIDHTYNMVFLK